MPRKIKVFISYRKKDPISTPIAQTIVDKLSQEKDRWEVFWDQIVIDTGEKWRESIYSNLSGSDDLDRRRHVRGSDVLVLLLDKETAESDWVQREVDIARGMHIAILPLVLNHEVDQSQVTTLLAVDDLQYWHFRATPAELDRLCHRLTGLAEKTYENQQNLIKKLQLKWEDVPIDRQRPRYVSYQLNTVAVPVTLHLACGNIVDHRNIDVIVNSENDYMQMARVFETNTVSAMVRARGAHFDSTEARMLHDTIQRELDHHVGEGRPVGIGKVFVTSSGHAESKLRRTGFRYVLHVAAVRTSQKGYLPVDDDNVKTCIVNCLDMIDKINQHNGVMSPPESLAYELQQSEAKAFRSIESIIFPLIGTGNARAHVDWVAEAMLAGCERYLENNPTTSLRDIYLAVYRERDLPIVEQVLNKAVEGGTLKRISPG